VPYENPAERVAHLRAARAACAALRAAHPGEYETVYAAVKAATLAEASANEGATVKRAPGPRKRPAKKPAVPAPGPVTALPKRPMKRLASTPVVLPYMGPRLPPEPKTVPPHLTHQLPAPSRVRYTPAATPAPAKDWTLCRACAVPLDPTHLSCGCNPGMLDDTGRYADPRFAHLTVEE
jgi:hypothetical protein